MEAAARLITAKRTVALASEIALNRMQNTDDITVLINENLDLTAQVKRNTDLLDEIQRSMLAEAH